MTLAHLDERARRAVAEILATRVTGRPAASSSSPYRTWFKAFHVEKVRPVSCLNSRARWRVLSPSRRAHSSTRVVSA
ncbi:MAG: hypothetical protein ACRDV7_10135, partial [Acidimicrobiia bacterium]